MKRRRLLLYLLASLAVIALSLPFIELRSDHFRGPAVRFLQSMYDRRIEVGEASFDLLGHVTLRDVRVFNPPGYAAPLLLRASRIRFYLGWTGGETSAFRPRHIELEDSEFWFERPDTLPWNTQDLWVRREGPVTLPTFELPISVRGARVNFSDSWVGRTGIAVSFGRTDIDYIVTSDGREIRTLLTCRDVPLPAGGVMDFELRVRPAARKAESTVRFRDAELQQLGPYYDFIRILQFDRGRADVEHHMEFDRNRVRVRGEVKLRQAEIRHPLSGTVFKDAAPEIAYANFFGDTEVRIDSVVVKWGKSVVTATGRASRRGMSPAFSQTTFVAEDAQAEDLAFLLCDPRFTATGPVKGRCALIMGGDSAPAGEGVYNVAFDLKASDVKYGQMIRKQGGVPGGLQLDGRTGRRPDRIAIELGRSRCDLLPVEGGWRLRNGRLTGEDLTAYVVPFAHNRRLKIEGPVEAALELRSSGDASGTVNFSRGRITIDTWLNKEPGRDARLTFAGSILPDQIEARSARLVLGLSMIEASGRWSPASTDLKIRLERLDWRDAMRHAPWLKVDRGSRWSLDGSASGDIAVSSGGGNLSIDARLDLARTALVIEGLWRKPAGEPLDLALNGAAAAGTLRVSKGELRYFDTKLSVQGDISSAACDLKIAGSKTGLKGIRALLAGDLWKDMALVACSGEADISAAISVSGAAMKVAASVDAKEAALSLGDSWIKPPGEPFRVEAKVVKDAGRTRIEKLEFTQATSTLVYAGTMDATRRIEGKLKAEIDVKAFVPRAPMLERILVGKYKASEGLKLMADGKGIARLGWNVSGSADRPKIELDEKTVSGAGARILAASLGKLTNLVLSPLRFGTDFVKKALEPREESSKAGH